MKKERSLFYDFWPGIHVHDVRMQGNPAARLKAWASGVRKAVRAVKPAVVSVCDDGFKGFWIPFLLTGCGCPVVYERHVSRLIQADGLKSSALMKLEFALMRFLGKRFSRFVVLTPGNREEWPMANVEVIPNPLPFYPEAPSSGKRKKSDCRRQGFPPEKLRSASGRLEKGAR